MKRSEKEMAKIYDFEGRFEKDDKLGFRWFEVSQLKNNEGFFIIGLKYSMEKGATENFSKIYKNNTKGEYKGTPLERALAFLKPKLESGYVKTNDWNDLKNPKYHYPKDFEDTHVIEIINTELFLSKKTFIEQIDEIF
jgi:hypothetical protein